MKKKNTQTVKSAAMLNSPLAWPGGKLRMRKELIAEFPEHRFYGEVFGGAAWVLIGKPPSHSEAYNDRNGELTNFFNVVKVAPHEFILSLQYDLVSRETFQEFKKKMQEKPLDLSNIERAKMFYYLVKTSFGSMGETFGTTTTGKPRLNFAELQKIICQTHKRFERVTIENLDWKDFILRYDRSWGLFFLDPPYHIESSKDFYKFYLKDEDFGDMAKILEGIQGRFIMTLNDDQFVRETFKDFKIRETTTRYSIQKGSGKAVTELLIKNY